MLAAVHKQLCRTRTLSFCVYVRMYVHAWSSVRAAVPIVHTVDLLLSVLPELRAIYGSTIRTPRSNSNAHIPAVYLVRMYDFLGI